MPVCKTPLAALCLPAALFSLTPLPSFAQTPSDGKELAPVVVTATRQEMRASEVLADVTVIDREEIERAGQGTIVDLLSRQPGVQIMQQGGPGGTVSYYLRGANTNQTKVLVNGTAINNGTGAGSPLRYIPLADVERIEILRGPASMLYGADALGGVIHIITRRGEPGLKGNAFAGYGSHDTRQVAASVSGGNEHWRFRVEGNHFKTDGISSIRHARGKDADKDGYRNDGGAASLSFLPAKGHEIGFDYRQSKGIYHYDIDGSSASTVDARERFEIMQWRLFSRNRILSAWESEIAYGETEEDLRNFSNWNSTTSDYTDTLIKNRQISWQNNIDLLLGRALVAAEKTKQSIGPRQNLYGSIYNRTPEISNSSFLAGWTASADKHRWQINVRYDDRSDLSAKMTYGASYGYQITNEFRAHVSYGTAFRAPSITELYQLDWGGNPDLKPEKSRNFETGINWERRGHQVSAFYYHNRVKDLIVWQRFPGSTYDGQNENIGKALLEGVTFTYRGELGAWRPFAVYDWLNATNESTHQRLGRRARHKATLGLNHVWNNLETGVEWVVVSHRSDGYYPDKLGGYGLANLTARYAFSKDFSLEGRIDNLFNKKYEHALGYNTPGFNAFLGLRYSPR